VPTTTKLNQKKENKNSRRVSVLSQKRGGRESMIERRTLERTSAAY